MDTVDMNTSGCYIEHEMLIVDEYGEKTTCMGWAAQLAPAAVGRAALFNQHANDLTRSSFPAIDLPCVPVEAAAFPKCP